MVIKYKGRLGEWCYRGAKEIKVHRLDEPIKDIPCRGSAGCGDDLNDKGNDLYAGLNEKIDRLNPRCVASDISFPFNRIFDLKRMYVVDVGDAVIGIDADFKSYLLNDEGKTIEVLN